MKQKRRGVVICGAYGMGNAGDDAILAALLEEMRRIDPAMPVTVMTRHPDCTQRAAGVKYLSFWNIPGWFSAMCKARLFISGGGTLLQDVTSRRSLRFYLLTIRLARLAGCAVQLCGCGIGPLSGASRKRVAAVLNSCADAATLRDGDSLRLLEEMGVKKPRLLLAADPALSLPPDREPPEPSFGFVLREWDGFAAHIPDLAAAARYGWEMYHLKPAFLCMSPDDRSAARAVCERLPDMPYDIRPYGGRVTAVLSMRLHGLVFSLRDGVPAGGISYDPKVDAFCRDAGFPCLALENVTAERLKLLMDGLLSADRRALSDKYQFLRTREKNNGNTAEELLSDMKTPPRA